MDLSLILYLILTRFRRLSTSPTADTIDVRLPVSDTWESEDSARFLAVGLMDFVDSDEFVRTRPFILWFGRGDPSEISQHNG